MRARRCWEWWCYISMYTFHHPFIVLVSAITFYFGNVYCRWTSCSPLRHLREGKWVANRLCDKRSWTLCLEGIVLLEMDVTFHWMFAYLLCHLCQRIKPSSNCYHSSCAYITNILTSYTCILLQISGEWQQRHFAGQATAPRNPRPGAQSCHVVLPSFPIHDALIRRLFMARSSTLCAVPRFPWPSHRRQAFRHTLAADLRGNVPVNRAERGRRKCHGECTVGIGLHTVQWSDESAGCMVRNMLLLDLWVFVWCDSDLVETWCLVHVQTNTPNTQINYSFCFVLITGRTLWSLHRGCGR